MNNNPVTYLDLSGNIVECGIYAGTACAGEGPLVPTLIQDETGINISQHTEVSHEEVINGVNNAWEFTTSIYSILYEPIDWVITGSICIQGDSSLWMMAGLLPFIPSSVGSRIDDVIDIERMVGHHTIPRQVLRKLPKEIRLAVQGKRGAPNIWKIPKKLHKTLHSGPGRGGVYNDVWRKAIRTLEESGELNPKAILMLRDQIISKFGLVNWRR